MRYQKVGFAGLLSTMLWFAPVVDAESFTEDWAKSWPVVLEQRSGALTRRLDGALEIDTEDKGYIYFTGGRRMNDFAVTVRVKFLRADDKYSGINISSEKLWGRDAVDIALNPSGDRTTFLQIIADAAGGFDQFSHTADGSKFKWDGIKVASGKYDGGWVVEMSVPLSEMGLVPKSGHKWVGNFVRYQASDNMLTWSFMPGPAINDPTRMAEFVFE